MRKKEGDIKTGERRYAYYFSDLLKTFNTAFLAHQS